MACVLAIPPLKKILATENAAKTPSNHQTTIKKENFVKVKTRKNAFENDTKRYLRKNEKGNKQVNQQEIFEEIGLANSCQYVVLNIIDLIKKLETNANRQMRNDSMKSVQRY